MIDSGFQLKVLEGPRTGRVIHLHETEITLGRALGPDEEEMPGVVLFEEATVSRVHAVLVWDPHSELYLIRHRSNTNHTKVNHRVVKEKALQPGDRIVMGMLTLEVQLVPESPTRVGHRVDSAPAPPLVPAAPGLPPPPPPPPPTARPLPPAAFARAAGTAPAAPAVASHSQPTFASLCEEIPLEMEGRRLGNFLVGRELGRGSVGRVFLARQELLNLDRAIKVLNPSTTSDTNFMKRFQREARIAASLRHPNIIQVLDICMTDGLCYLVMEYLGSRSLYSVMQSHQGPFPVARTVRIVEQILSALDYAHSNDVVHRDIKPGNVLLNEARDSVAITDFSIAQIKDELRLTSMGVVLGTLEYMAPELFDGVTADARVDLYAVGVMLYELLTGVLPFKGKTNSEIIKAQLLHTPQSPTTLNSQVPESLAAITYKALEKDPQKRFSSAHEMREAILKVTTG